MNHCQRKYVDVLQRRLQHLKDRVQEAKSAGEPDPHYDRAEIAALHFALECVGLAAKHHLITTEVGLQP